MTPICRVSEGVDFRISWGEMLHVYMEKWISKFQSQLVLANFEECTLPESESYHALTASTFLFRSLPMSTAPVDNAGLIDNGKTQS